jgi:cytochrome c oxidase subunit 4
VAQQGPRTQASQTEHASHGHGPGRYFIVWALLLVFTLTTVITGRMDLGAINLPLALTIATIKASLVVLFFMHMSEAAGTNRLVFAVSLIFLLVMIFGVFGDLWTRNEMTLPSAAPSTLGPEF